MQGKDKLPLCVPAHQLCGPSRNSVPCKQPRGSPQADTTVGCCCVRSSSSPWGFHATVLSNTSAFSSSRVYLCLQSLNLLNKKL